MYIGQNMRQLDRCMQFEVQSYYSRLDLAVFCAPPSLALKCSTHREVDQWERCTIQSPAPETASRLQGSRQSFPLELKTLTKDSGPLKQSFQRTGNLSTNTSDSSGTGQAKTRRTSLNRSLHRRSKSDSLTATIRRNRASGHSFAFASMAFWQMRTKPQNASSAEATSKLCLSILKLPRGSCARRVSRQLRLARTSSIANGRAASFLSPSTHSGRSASKAVSKSSSTCSNAITSARMIPSQVISGFHRNSKCQPPA